VGSALNILVGGTAAVWAVRTGLASLAVVFFSGEPMLICIPQMCLVLQSEQLLGLMIDVLEGVIERRYQTRPDNIQG